MDRREFPPPVPVPSRARRPGQGDPLFFAGAGLAFLTPFCAASRPPPGRCAPAWRFRAPRRLPKSCASTAGDDVLLSPVASMIRRPDPTPSLQPRYGPSSLLRVGPSQRPTSVLSPHGLLRLNFSLCIGAAGSYGSTATPASASRPLNAGRRSPSPQASGELVPGRRHIPGFDDVFHVTTLHRWTSLSLVSRTHTCSRCSLNFAPNAHDHAS